ncbi:MAG: hypothetical protein ABIO94_07210, partial [Opitutaceae bacterium]
MNPTRVLRAGFALVASSVLQISAQEAPPRSSQNSVARHPVKDDSYTITSVLQIVHPVRPADMADEFQDVRVLAQDKDSATVEITYYPLHQPVVG